MEDITSAEAALATFEQALRQNYTHEEVHSWIKEFSQPYLELMSYYKCAIMEVETKFRVLDENLSLMYDRNPIETIKTRLKSPESIIEKMHRLGHRITVENIEQNLHDIAGIRVICSFQNDVYTIARAFLSQDDVKVIAIKDYIKNPKPSGYRSLHLIVSVPIFLSNKKKNMQIEVQLRTLAMDVWASLEHKIRYKKDAPIDDDVIRNLYQCGAISTLLDSEFERIYYDVYDIAKEEISLDSFLQTNP